MTPERYDLAARIFEKALDREPGGRAAFLEEACGEDRELRRDVESLLQEHDHAEGFLEKPAIDRDPLVGTILESKYRLDSLLGRGGMGAVYRGVQIAIDRPVAVKVMPRSTFLKPSAIERFKREAVAVARLRHPGIVRIYDSGFSEEVGGYLVMELLQGVTLREEMLRSGRIATARARRIIAEVCAAVQAAHEAGVIHRDLKPDNVFLASDGSVKVLDFGTAKLGGAARLTRKGSLVGTPGYMAPEQCRGGEVDARTDVYALGCLAYEILTGEAPFVAPTTGALIKAHLQAMPPPPSQRSPDLDPALDAAVLRALAKSPQERYASAADLASALERA